MKKLISLIGVICILFTSCTKEEQKEVEVIEEDTTIKVEEIKLSNDNETIEVGKTIQLTTKILPEDTTNTKILFTSSKDEIATISENGLITGLTIGQTLITASNEAGTVSANCIINVKEAFINVTGINLSNPILSMIIGDTYQINPIISPDNATNKKVKYFCNGSDGIVEMTATGFITALKAGSAEYAIITVDGEKKIEGTIYVESPSPKGSFVDERDSKKYKTIKIGKQIWMAENLAYLPSVNSPSDYDQEKDCYYVFGYDGTNVDDAKATENYTNLGVLYNWKTAQSAAPNGWHLPTEEEWQELEITIGMTATQAGQNWQRGAFATKLKSTSGWAEDGTQGINDIGFNGNPSGYTDHSGFYGQEFNTRYWTATSTISYLAYIRGLNAYQEEITRTTGTKSEGYTVRCIKD